MLQIDKENITKLKNGDFSDVHLHEWFTNHDFAYIFATIDGCFKHIDYDTLNFIAMYAHEYLERPNAEDWLDIDSLKRLIETYNDYPYNIDQMNYEELLAYWNKQISKICEQILEKIIVLSSKYAEYQPIITKLGRSNNENIRLHCCANGNYFDYLNDKSQRVRDVATIRYRFNSQIRYSNTVQRKRIDFLTKVLEIGVIRCYDNGTNYEDPNLMDISFDSLLFEESYTLHRFFKDIFYTIQDKRILAAYIDTLIKEQVINFKEDMMPPCFADEKSLNTRHL